MSFKDMLENMDEFDSEDSFVNKEALDQFRQMIDDPAFEEVIDVIFDALGKYYRSACWRFTEEQAFELTAMVFARFLETGRLL